MPTNADTIKPYNDAASTKKDEVQQMFNAIAPSYDFLNHFLSLGIDKRWRRRAVEKVAVLGPQRVLDVATGTGDMAIMINRLLGCRVTGADISAGMLEVAKGKIAAAGLCDVVDVREADSERLPFADGEFDAVTVAFGARNYQDLDQGLRDMARVTRRGGRVVVLEFSRPRRFPFKQIYMFYFRHILPLMGGLVSKDKRAYEYLPQSVLAFPDGDDFLRHMSEAGLQPIERQELTLGVATVYVAEKV